MNSIEIQNHMSCTSFSNHNPTDDDVCCVEEKSILMSPKSQLLNASTTGTIPSSLHKSVQVDLKQQFSGKLKLGGIADGSESNDHHPIKPTRSITPKRNASLHNDIDDSNNNNQKQQQHRSSSVRSNDSTIATTVTASSTMSSTTTGMTTTTGNGTGSKNVQFANDRRGNVICVYYKNTAPKTKPECMDCFYQMNDFQQFRRECKQEALLQQKTTTYRDNFAAVYAACTTGDFKNVTRERAYISAATCRGLEVVVFPTLHSDRKNTIATVLRTQASLPMTMKYIEQCEAIAAASRYLSKQARQLARVFGSGDAAVVIANQRLESISAQSQSQKQPGGATTTSSSSADNNSPSQTKQLRRKSKANLVVPHCFVSC